MPNVGLVLGGAVIAGVGAVDVVTGFLYKYDGRHGELFGFGGTTEPHTLSFNVVNLALLVVGLILFLIGLL